MTTPSNLLDVQVTKLSQLVAISTPIPAQDGRTSKKTPVFQLPVYEIDLKLAEDENEDIKQKTRRFHCDLADLSDLIEKLKSLENQWRRSG